MINKKILKFEDFLIEQNRDELKKDEEEIGKLDDEINQTRLEFKKKQLELLKNKKKQQDKDDEYTDSV